MTPIERQTVLITGSTDGLGRATAQALAAQGASVLVHGRSPQRIEATLQDIAATTGKPAGRGYCADLADLRQVRRLAGEVAQSQTRIDLLINNAGIGAGNLDKPRRETSADGYELRFAVNYLSHFLITLELLPLLQTGAPSRIVNVSSVGQEPLDFDDLMLERRYDGFDAYKKSKLAQIMFTIDLAARLKDKGVTVNALHPASLMDTKMVLEWFGRTMSTVKQGVEAVMYLAVSPALDGVSGRYFDGKRESRANSQAYDAAARRRLWEASEKLAGISAS